MMTYEDLKAKLFEGDPIAEVEFPERVLQDESGLTILGGADAYTDLHIAIQGDKLILRWRDGESVPDTDLTYGREWSKPCEFDDFDDMHTWIYEL